MDNSIKVNKDGLDGEFNFEDDTRAISEIFSPIRDMAEVYSNGKEGKIYSCVCRDSIGKRAELALVIKYPDGGYSETIYVKQSELFQVPIPRIIQDIKSNSIMKSKELADRELEGAEALKMLKSSKILKRLADYSSPSMPINYVRLFYILQKHYDLLPVKEFAHKSTLMEVYHAIKVKAEAKAAKDPNDNESVDGNNYNLLLEDILEIADEHGYELKELLKEISFYGILNTDKDRKRFQYSKTVNGDKKRFYSFKNEVNLRKLLNRQPVVNEIPYEKAPKCYSMMFREIKD